MSFVKTDVMTGLLYCTALQCVGVLRKGHWVQHRNMSADATLWHPDVFWHWVRTYIRLWIHRQSLLIRSVVLSLDLVVGFVDKRQRKLRIIRLTFLKKKKMLTYLALTSSCTNKDSDFSTNQLQQEKTERCDKKHNYCKNRGFICWNNKMDI